MDKGEMHNAHVYEYYALLCRFAEYCKRPFAQIHYYTLAEKERDPDWKPEHLR